MNDALDLSDLFENLILVIIQIESERVTRSTLATTLPTLEKEKVDTEQAISIALLTKFDNWLAKKDSVAANILPEDIHASLTSIANLLTPEKQIQTRELSPFFQELASQFASWERKIQFLKTELAKPIYEALIHCISAY